MHFRGSIGIFRQIGLVVKEYPIRLLNPESGERRAPGLFFLDVAHAPDRGDEVTGRQRLSRIEDGGAGENLRVAERIVFGELFRHDTVENEIVADEKNPDDNRRNADQSSGDLPKADSGKSHEWFNSLSISANYISL